MQITKNIHLKELQCRCGCATPPEVLTNLVTLAFMLQRIRDFYGRPIRITSGYRCASHNMAVGGVSRSYHMLGMAADFNVDGIAPRVLAASVLGCMQDATILAGGLKAYTSFVHYDFRGVVTKF